MNQILHGVEHREEKICIFSKIYGMEMSHRLNG